MADQPDPAPVSTPEAPREKRSLGEYFEKVWGQALLAVSTVEDESRTAAQRMAQVYGLGQDEVRRQTRILAERLVHQRKELERNLEESVQRALQRVKVPRRETLTEVLARLEQLEERIARVEEEQGPTPPSA
jgi:polyhydroxyalkanoate synthesis regulator phasin